MPHPKPSFLTVVLRLVCLWLIQGCGSPDTVDSHLEAARGHLNEAVRRGGSSIANIDKPSVRSALAEYEMALAIKPNNREAVVGIYHCYRLLGRVAEAKQLLVKELERRPSDSVLNRLWKRDFAPKPSGKIIQKPPKPAPLPNV